MESFASGRESSDADVIHTPEPEEQGPTVPESEDASPELTTRAVGAGLLVGTALACANMYFGLQTGWVSMQAMQSALLGYGLFRMLPTARIWGRDLTVKENVVLQTTAVSVGTMPLAAGFVGIIPALAMLSEEKDGAGSRPVILTPIELLAWCTGVAFFGVFLAIPLRKQVIVKDQLPFPSGTATARVISVLHETSGESSALAAPKPTTTRRRRAGYQPLSQEDDVEQSNHPDFGTRTRDAATEKDVATTRKAWKYLLVSFAGSAVYTIVAQLAPVIYNIPIFDVIHSGLASNWRWWLTPSPSYVGQGIIMGFPTTLAMNAGMLTAWAILSPLAKLHGWAPGPVGSSEDGVKGWVLWPALAIMIAESVVSLGQVAFTMTRSLHWHRKPERVLDDPAEDPDESRRQNRLAIAGFAASTVVCVIVMGIIFPPAIVVGDRAGITWWATCIGVALAAAFSYLGVKALGETDLNPVSAIGKISQLAFAVVQRHNVLANIVAGGISEAGAQQAGDLMQDLKTGHLLNASPMAQFYGQLIGSAFSIFVSTGLYLIYSRTYDLPGSEFAVPTAAIWLNLARLLNRGELPPKSEPAMIIFGTVAVVASVTKTVMAVSSSPRLRAASVWVPSTIAFAIGFINPPSFSLARLVGGVIALRFSLRQRTATSTQGSALASIGLVTVASGLVLGEGLASIAGVAMKSTKVAPLTCWGCDVGGGGYCGGC